jgi:hypothetical protein
VRILDRSADRLVAVPGERPLVGFRIWRGGPLRVEPRLSSAHQVGTWPPGVDVRAICLPWDRPVPPTHAAPDPGCGCGIHAFFSRELLEAYASERRPPRALGEPLFYVAGVVLGWGSVAVGVDGWRSEWGRPVALLRRDAPPEVAEWTERAALRYGVRIVDDWLGQPIDGRLTPRLSLAARI